MGDGNAKAASERRPLKGCFGKAALETGLPEPPFKSLRSKASVRKPPFQSRLSLGQPS
jgi:hypothetical protein